MSETTPSSVSPPNMGEIREELRQDAQGIKDTAQRSLENRTEVGKAGLIKAANSASAALRAAGDTLTGDTAAPDWLSSGFSQASDKLADLAKTLDGKSASDISREAVGFARDHPAAFLAASAAAGFAVARVFRAGASYRAMADNDARDLEPQAPATSGDTLGGDDIRGFATPFSGQSQ